jgi:hypothetical protein
VRVVVDDFGIGIANVYAVPPGKRLSIQHVALKSNLPENGTSLHADVLVGPANSEFEHPLNPVLQNRSDFSTYVMNHPLLAFANEGTQVSVRAILVPSFAEGRDGTVALEGTLSGYLEDAP